MAFEVKVPAVGESVQEGEIYKWHKNTGDYVEVDEVLVELETDKATVEIVAEAAGILEITTEEGATVAVGDLLAKIDTDAAPSVAPKSESPAAAVSSAGSEKVLSPAARRVADQHNVDTSDIAGTGRGGRLTKEDVSGAVSSTSKAPVAPTPAPAAKAQSPERATPAKAVKGQRTERREKMSRLRQKIAERLVTAQHEAAMLTTFNEVDLTNIMKLRKSFKEPFKEAHGVGLGFMSFFVSAATQALEAYPAINGYIDGNEIIYHDYVDIGVAVSTAKGLMVPVLRDCSELSFAEIEAGIMDFGVRGRAGKITVDDLTGGTFTISNGGVFGSLMSTPILNPPQSAILGMHTIQQRPVVVDGEIKARPMMYLALSYDHRVVDGKEAVGFLVKIKERVEEPARLLLGV